MNKGFHTHPFTKGVSSYYNKNITPAGIISSKPLDGNAATNCKCLNKYIGIHNLPNCKLNVSITKKCNVSRHHVIDNGVTITTSNRFLVLNDHTVLSIVSPMNDDTSRNNVIALRDINPQQNGCPLTYYHGKWKHNAFCALDEQRENETDLNYKTALPEI